MTRARVVICPYCGETQPAGERCRSCAGYFEALSRQATHNEMGPWFVHDRERPFRPGCGYETLARMIGRGQVTKYSIIRGPTTRQFWTVAKHVPGVAHLLGYCHVCDATVDPRDHGCPSCGAPFGAYLDRNYLGLPEVRPLPGEAPDEPAVPDGAQKPVGLELPMSVRPAPPVSHTPHAPHTPRAPQGAPHGISSFAPDEELLGDGPGAAGPVLGAGAGWPGGTLAAPTGPPTTQRALSPADSAALERRGMPFGGAVDRRGASWVADTASADLIAHPLTRSLQRRLARQQRTIRLLSVLVFAVAIAAVAISLLTAAGGRHGMNAPALEPAPRAAVDEPAGTAPALPSQAAPPRPIEQSAAAPTAPADDLDQPPSRLEAPPIPDASEEGMRE